MYRQFIFHKRREASSRSTAVPAAALTTTHRRLNVLGAPQQTSALRLRQPRSGPLQVHQKFSVWSGCLFHVRAMGLHFSSGEHIASKLLSGSVSMLIRT